MRVLKLPKLVLAIVQMNRHEIFELLHHKADIIYLEEERFWIVISYDLVTDLLKDSNLCSDRFEYIKTLFPEECHFDLKRFYSQWLMYKDGSDHLNNRKLFILSLKNCDLLCLKVKFKSYLNCKINQFDEQDAIDFSSFVILPYVKTALAAITGLEESIFDKIYETLLPILEIMHGRKIHYSTDQYNVKKLLSDWLHQLNDIKQNDYRNGIFDYCKERQCEIDDYALIILPFLDVIDVLHSLCSDILIWILDNLSNNTIMVKKVPVNEIIRYYSPFQTCNRIISGKVSLFKDIEYSIGDRVSLLIGAANLDVNKHSEAGAIHLSALFSHLSFGRGDHRCPGQSISMLLLNVFANQMVTYIERSNCSFRYEIKSSISWNLSRVENLKLFKLPKCN